MMRRIGAEPKGGGELTVMWSANSARDCRSHAQSSLSRTCGGTAIHITQHVTVKLAIRNGRALD